MVELEEAGGEREESEIIIEPLNGGGGGGKPCVPEKCATRPNGLGNQ